MKIKLDARGEKELLLSEIQIIDEEIKKLEKRKFCCKFRIKEIGFEKRRTTYGSKKCNICHKRKAIWVWLLYPIERITRAVCSDCYPKEMKEIFSNKKKEVLSDD